ncbi:MAG: hypothetical protein AAFY76_18045, partial [Cyanobacteria bacterium J06649_11]
MWQFGFGQNQPTPSVKNSYHFGTLHDDDPYRYAAYSYRSSMDINDPWNIICMQLDILKYFGVNPDKVSNNCIPNSYPTIFSYQINYPEALNEIVHYDRRFGIAYPVRVEIDSMLLSEYIHLIKLESYVTIIIQCLKISNYDVARKCINLLKAGIEQGQFYDHPYYYLAQMYEVDYFLKQKKYDDALLCALQIERDCMVNHLNDTAFYYFDAQISTLLAEIYDRLGEKELAVKYFNQIIAQTPEDLHKYHRTAHAYLANHETNLQNILAVIKYSLLTKNFADAMECIVALRKTMIKFDLQHLRYTIKQLREIEHLFPKVSDIPPTIVVEFYTFLGECYLRIGKAAL